MRVHSGEQSYIFVLFGAKYSVVSTAFDGHVRVHSDEKSYGCAVCEVFSCKYCF